MNEPDNFYSEFGYYAHHVVTLLDKRSDDMLRENLGISLAQFMLLRVFDTYGATLPSQQTIADRLGIVKSGVSRHIDIARQNSWIEVAPDPAMRRQNTVTLTPKGKQLLAEAKALIENAEAIGFENIPRADIEATIRTLRRLSQTLKN